MPYPYPPGGANPGPARQGGRLAGYGGPGLPTAQSYPQGQAPWLQKPQYFRDAEYQWAFRSGHLTAAQLLAPRGPAGAASTRYEQTRPGAQAAMAAAASGLIRQSNPYQRTLVPQPRVELAQTPLGDDGRLHFACVLNHGPFDALQAVILVKGVGKARGETHRRSLMIDAAGPDQALSFRMWNAGPCSLRLVAWRQGRPVYSNQVDITFDPSVQLRDGGGPARALLNGKAVTLIPPGSGGVSGWVAKKLEKTENATLALDLLKLRKWIADKAKSTSASGGAAATSAGGAAEFPVEAVARMNGAIEQAIKEFGLIEAIIEQMPLIAQAAAAGTAVNELRKWVGAQWSLYKIDDHRQMLDAVPAASRRRPTVIAATEGFTQYKTQLGQSYLAKAGAKTAEVGIRFIPGSSQIVGAVVNGGAVALRILKNYEEAELAERTNGQLAACETSLSPGPYYDVIRHGHVAVLCHILAGYHEAQILDLDRRSRMVLDGVVPIVGVYARAKDALKNFRKPPDEPKRLVSAVKAATALKARAEDVQDELRYEITARLTPHAPQRPRPTDVRPRGRQ